MLNVIICDDIREYADHLAERIDYVLDSQGWTDHTIVRVYNLEDLFAAIDKQRADLVFLDIRIGELNAVDEWIAHPFLRQRAELIVMTAYPEECYSVSDADCRYLLLKSHADDDKKLRNAILAALGIPNVRINLELGKKIRQTVNSADIRYIENLDKKSVFNHRTLGDISAVGTLRKYEPRLPYGFIRCHRGFFVNAIYLTGFKFNGGSIWAVMNNGVEIPVSDTRREETVAAYEKFKYLTSREIIDG